jgi:hypothetical protein
MLTFRHLAPLTLLAVAGAAAAADAPKKEPPPAAAATTTAAPARTSTTAPPATNEAGRDWRRIDTNGDHAISPEEMERYLAANPGPLKK